MRRYGSFLVRWWQAGAAGQRLSIRHVQSDEELTVAALEEALGWMAARVVAAERAPPPEAGLSDPTARPSARDSE